MLIRTLGKIIKINYKGSTNNLNIDSLNPGTSIKFSVISFSENQTAD